MSSDPEEALLLQPAAEPDSARTSLESSDTASIILATLNGHAAARHKAERPQRYTDKPGAGLDDTLGNGHARRPESFDLEDADPLAPAVPRPSSRRARLWLCIVAALCLVGWAVAAAQFAAQKPWRDHPPPDKTTATAPGAGPSQAPVAGGGGGAQQLKKIELDEVLGGMWRAARHDIRWIAGPNGEDGLLLDRGGSMDGYLIVDDVRNRDGATVSGTSRRVLMDRPQFSVGGRNIYPTEAWPSPDMKTVLILSDRKSNWRHSFTGLYWLFDVATQTAEPLDPRHPNARIQLASWSPQSDAVAFTRDNNLYLRKLDAQKTVVQVTTDGGTELFYGVPDWVYEEEVFSGNSATWWSKDGQYIAFLRTNESMVPSYPVQYFMSRPSGTTPKPGLENYPEVRQIKYPKSGAPNPIVHIQFYDIAKRTVFSVNIDGDFPDHDRLITEVVWAGNNVLFKETNRVSDILKVILVDTRARTGRTVREQDVKALDGGWFEVSQETRYIPADPAAGRPNDGYVDTVIHDGYDHLAYFSPVDSPTPRMLTSGAWEAVKAPSAVDLKNNWVYYVSTYRGSIYRHVYRVKLDGGPPEPITDDHEEGYFDISLSAGAGYALLDYKGPSIPYQKVLSMPGNTDAYEQTVEDNARLRGLAADHALPTLVYGNITLGGFWFNVLERRPPGFDPRKRYPVLFWQYQGPGSQSVDKTFNIDFQAYVAASLGYLVVTLDGRGTGFVGRAARCAVRGNIGHWEAADQIAAAKSWAQRAYVDEERMAIWGWSYGGFMALKTLEMDAGRTFKYGMAVAPVTDWRFYGPCLSSSFAARELTVRRENRLDIHGALHVHAAAQPRGLRQRFDKRRAGAGEERALPRHARRGRRQRAHAVDVHAHRQAGRRRREQLRRAHLPGLGPRDLLPRRQQDRVWQ
jgi:dipeptidyl aminopeptidase